MVIHAIKLANALIGDMIWRCELPIQPRHVLYHGDAQPQAINMFHIPSKRNEMLNIQQIWLAGENPSLAETAICGLLNVVCGSAQECLGFLNPDPASCYGPLAPLGK